MDKLDNHSQNMDRSKMKFTRIIFKMYCISIIFFSLIPIFIITLPILNKIETSVEESGKKLVVLSYIETLICNFVNIYSILIFVSGIMMFFVWIYTLIKIIIYEGIKAGKNKRGIKEYFLLYKDGL
ncbi:hypothetical protein PVBG_05636 [Plasmodium vivax Brazil I]|uniref:Uncharacterized protein n=1 Tax=Plasmodium vivax (strain Brazil I) TaxID=1033975 RepID=A0A0J9T0F2_PLAV1|nr:hypothetical protein PVBG_05636 [Plasmodium vivax Brazil I]